MNPKVYLIHATEDKDKFVVNFAIKLREKGVDVWLDKWEMLPGDSLVDKMFEEGIKESEIFIIVLSNISIQKPWVREELNACILKKVNKGSKVIPVLIEDCDVPQVLKPILWEKIKNIKSYENEFQRIVNSIYGTNDKPTLGLPPAHTVRQTGNIPGLNDTDSLIFCLLCEEALNTKNLYVHPYKLEGKISNLDLDKTAFNDSLNILEEEGFISCHRAECNTIVMIDITLGGFDKYINNDNPEFTKILNNVVSLIVNEKYQDNESIIKKLNVNKVLVNHTLRILETHDLINLSDAEGNYIFITNVSVKLKRMLQN